MDDNEEVDRMAPLSMTHKALAEISGQKRKLFLESPQNINKPTNKLIEAAKTERKEDETMRRELPEDEFKDFLSYYDDTAYHQEEKKQPLKKPAFVDTGITDEIKEEDEDKDSENSDEND
jgi:hypothetical protein